MRPRRAPFLASPRRDPHQTLIEALGAVLPPAARLLDSRSTPWASVTFVGARHELHYAFDPADRPAAATMLARLAEAEFALPGHFVAEIGGAQRPDGIAIEALTVELD